MRTSGRARAGGDRALRKSLGQFFTPEPVATFAWRALGALGMELPARARIADPSLGEGVFLKAGFSAGAVGPDAVAVGVDLDPRVAPGWPAEWRTAVGDGLLDHPEIGLVPGTFDAVVGNPPYGGDGLAILGPLARGEPSPDPASSARARALARAILDRYSVWKASGEANPGASGVAQVDLFASSLPSPAERATLRRLLRFPIEVLFLERFAALLRPGGWLACVLPDGLLANAEAGRWRDAMREALDPFAVIALPGTAFHGVGASARTALLLARRRGPGLGDPPDVWMASPERGQGMEEYLDEVLAALAGRGEER
ncbi:hypothetical protein L6R50_10465 [Myxococcota bacterium]|nr:hypothetical protein [Myxococcota bacterium]